MKQTLMIAALMMSLATVAQAKKENKGADAQAVDMACTQDAATAKCGDEKVGTGLMKCLHAYKKANKDFKFSDGCKSAMKTMHEDRKATK